MLALILTRKLRPIAIGSASGWLMFDGMMARPRAISSRTNSGGDEVGDAGAEVLAVARGGERGGAAEVLADGDIFHLGRDDAAAGVGDLRHRRAGPRAQRRALDVGEGLGVRPLVEHGAAGQAVVLGLHLAAEIALDVAARLDPRAAQLGQAGVDVDRRVGVGVGAAGIVDADRRLVRARLEHDLAHGDAQVRVERAGDMDLAAAGQRAGGDGDFER